MKNRFVTVVACALLGALATVLAGQAPSGDDLTLVDMGGTQKILSRLPASVYAPRVSPNGRQVAFETRDPKGPDGGRLWVADFANIANRRALPSTGAPLNWAPMWTPDGQRLAAAHREAFPNHHRGRIASALAARRKVVVLRSRPPAVPG